MFFLALGYKQLGASKNSSNKQEGFVRRGLNRVRAQFDSSADGDGDGCCGISQFRN